MTQLPLIDPAASGPPVSELFAEVQRRFGATPNMTRAMANSPALLKGYLELSAALSRGALGPATSERIALAVAQGNACSYCLSAHSYLAEHGRGTVTSEDLAEIIGQVALNVLTNYFTKAADVDIDLPVVPA